MPMHAHSVTNNSIILFSIELNVIIMIFRRDSQLTYSTILRAVALKITRRCASIDFLCAAYIAKNDLR
ncbi:hypothetical protein IMSAG192_00083 [Muribaculaceae bacterium]|nr:hypothetical protein IMSAG192_00083 [Muribaculaceae bacterium]